MHMWQTEVHFPPAQVRSEPLDVQQLVSSPDARRRASAEAGSMTELLWKVEGKMRPRSADRRCVSGLESACNTVALRSLAQVITKQSGCATCQSACHGVDMRALAHPLCYVSTVLCPRAGSPSRILIS